MNVQPLAWFSRVFGWFPHQDAWKNHRETMQFRPIRLLVFRRVGVDRNERRQGLKIVPGTRPSAEAKSGSSFQFFDFLGYKLAGCLVSGVSPSQSLTSPIPPTFNGGSSTQLNQKMWMNKVGQRRYLGGGNSNIFWNFHPENWGRFSTHFDDHNQIFQRGWNVQPPTR